MKTQRVKFQDIPVRAYFYDFSHSGEWMLKLDDEVAMWEDGLQTTFNKDDVIEVIYPK